MVQEVESWPQTKSRQLCSLFEEKNIKLMPEFLAEVLYLIHVMRGSEFVSLAYSHSFTVVFLFFDNQV